MIDLNASCSCLTKPSSGCQAYIRIIRHRNSALFFISRLNLAHSCNKVMHIGKTAATRKRHLSRQFSSLVPNIKSPMDATRSHAAVAVSNMYGDQVNSSVAGRVLQAERV